MCPEEADGTALEEQEEEVHGAEDHNSGEGGEDDEALVPFAGQAEEVGGDGKLRDCCSYDIEKFADEDDLGVISCGCSVVVVQGVG